MCATSFGLYLGNLQECQHKNHIKKGILAYVEYCTYPILIKSFQRFLLGIYPICSTPPPSRNDTTAPGKLGNTCLMSVCSMSGDGHREGMVEIHKRKDWPYCIETCSYGRM